VGVGGGEGGGALLGYAGSSLRESLRSQTAKDPTAIFQIDYLNPLFREKIHSFGIHDKAGKF